MLDGNFTATCTPGTHRAAQTLTLSSWPFFTGWLHAHGITIKLKILNMNLGALYACKVLPRNMIVCLSENLASMRFDCEPPGQRRGAPGPANTRPLSSLLFLLHFSAAHSHRTPGIGALGIVTRTRHRAFGIGPGNWKKYGKVGSKSMKPRMKIETAIEA